MVEQPRVQGVFERARHAAISSLLNRYDGTGGYRPQRKIDFNHFVMALGKDADFKAYARTLVDRPETKYHAERLAQALDQDVHLPGSDLLHWSRVTRHIGRAAKAVERFIHLERGVPPEELLPDTPVGEVDAREQHWFAAMSRAADCILSDLHNEAALKRTVVVRNKRLDQKRYVVHESMIHLTSEHADRLRQLAAEAQGRYV